MYVFLRKNTVRTDEVTLSLWSKAFSDVLWCYAVSCEDKPSPKAFKVNELYNFDTWSDQVISFIETKIKEPAYVVCNSVGGVAGLTAAVKRPDLIKGIVLINISLRLLHVRHMWTYVLWSHLTVVVWFVRRRSRALCSGPSHRCCKLC